MHIALVSAECAPIAKAGGLGDFVQGLAHELIKAGDSVEVWLPAYDVLRRELISGLAEADAPLQVPFYQQRIHCRLLSGDIEGIPLRLFDPQSEQRFFQRSRIYGDADDAERFAFFCSAVLEHFTQSERPPDILHCNDWQTGLLPVLLAERCGEQAQARTCYTLHNVGYQGKVAPSILDQVGLNSAALMTQDRLADPHQPGMANLMKGGILYAGFVNTVSPRYAWEVQNTEQGMGLQSVFRDNRHKFGGILNGIDASVWGPEVDAQIPVNFSAGSLPKKAVNRRELRTRLGLQEVEKPIFAVVSRLDRQKGVDLIEHGVRYALAEGGQAVLLGSSLDPDINKAFTSLKAELGSGPDCHLELGYDESLAHLIYAGADMILIPSLYEPCGLTQLIAMKYGTVPIVRRVGGLADTVFDAHYSDKSFDARNGYVFDDPTEAGLEDAMSRAIGLWQRFPQYFRQLRVNGMRGDYSWRKPAQDYREIYKRLEQLAAPAQPA
ncbi:glycogen synthase [Thiorhodococcus mannitoliphagus]|uniref:Glycogen synthase n=1 Tax=Thiorhodococcus mannitoliphagus TaxID=329406 RepID=A0A6P1DVE4_9GAMM|nr:glycogen synthase [Thiorhodococcus mannitoliphagus]NEX21689.1 glycogen synthase [Thiorhodococcus mannitoliphagus]